MLLDEFLFRAEKQNSDFKTSKLTLDQHLHAGEYTEYNLPYLVEEWEKYDNNLRHIFRINT